MKISRNSWHFKLYYFYMKRFCRDYEYPEQVNLCPYIRTIFLWLPLNYGLHLIMLSAMPLVFIFAGTMAYCDGELKQLLMVLMLCILGFSGLFGIIMLIGYIVDKSKKEHTTLLGTWVKAKHDKICPVINVVGV